MSTINILLIIIVSLLAIFIGLFIAVKGVFAPKKDKPKRKRSLNRKEKSNLIKSSNRRLAQNPKDPKALLSLSDLYFSEGDFDKAVRTLSILDEIAQYNRNINKFDVQKKYAISLLKTGNKEEAYRTLQRAVAMEPLNFEVNFNLGVLEYQQKKYDTAINHLRIAKNQNPAHLGTVRYLGLSYYKMHRYKDGLLELKHALDGDSEDKEVLFAIGQCYNAIGNKDQALKIFFNLRTEPTVGPLAALHAGGIYLQTAHYQEAISNFDIGLKHKNIPQDVYCELKYRLALTYIQLQNLPLAMDLFKEIYTTNPNYKDVSNQIQKYSSLVSNKNLSTFLLGGQQDFANLCRKIANAYFAGASVKIIDMSITQNQYLDIVTTVNTRKWEDVVIFRFIRNTGRVSDLILRELYSKMKEEKAGRAACMTAGVFTDEAKTFVEARLIDLIESADLEKLLKKIGANVL